MGRATAILCYGTCFAPHGSVTGLEVVVDGVHRHPVAAEGMPRPDVFHRLHPALGVGRPPRRDPASAEDPEIRAYRSGFWVVVPIEAHRAPGEIVLTLAARLGGGRVESAPLGTIPVVAADPHPRPAPDPRPGLIAVAMATFEPDPELFDRQVESLRAQTDRDWVCVISDDCSGAEHVERIHRILADDERFVFDRSNTRAGFYRNFERALELVPPEAELIALCDQDDRWYPDKLAALRAGLGGAGLAYSDQRLVDPAGAVLRETMWEGRRTNHTDLASLLVANTITGASMLLRREIRDLALPFPDLPGLQFHDHWLALVALAAGEVAYVDRPLYDYVQHGGAIFGDVSTRGGAGPVVAPWRRMGRGLRGGRAAYFLGYLQRAVQARALLARCGPRLTPGKRRTLERFLASERSPAAFAWLAARTLRPLWGHDETLGSEIELAHGLVWRRALALGAKGTRAPGRRPLDATFPAPLDFEQRRIKRWRAGA